MRTRRSRAPRATVCVLAPPTRSGGRGRRTGRGARTGCSARGRPQPAGRAVLVDAEREGRGCPNRGRDRPPRGARELVDPSTERWVSEVRRSRPPGSRERLAHELQAPAAFGVKTTACSSAEAPKRASTAGARPLGESVDARKSGSPDAGAEHAPGKGARGGDERRLPVEPTLVVEVHLFLRVEPRVVRRPQLVERAGRLPFLSTAAGRASAARCPAGGSSVIATFHHST